MKIWWGEFIRDFLPGGGGGKEQIFGWQRETPLIFSGRENIARGTAEKLHFIAKSLQNINLHNFCLIESMATKF